MLILCPNLYDYSYEYQELRHNFLCLIFSQEQMMSISNYHHRLLSID